MIKKILKPKIIIIVVILIIVIALGSYKLFFADKESSYSFATVKIGDVIQEISAIGQVRKGEEIELGFKETGRIEKTYVQVGQEIEFGQELIKLETTQLYIQLREARATLDLAQAELDKLLAGATPEEIQVAQTTIENAEISLDDAKQNLGDVQTQAQENLSSAYEDALNTLDEAYLKAYNAFNKVDLIQRTYFAGNDQESLRVKENKDKIEDSKDQAKSYLDSAKADPTNENIDLALSQMIDALDDIYEALEIIRDVCEEGTYRNTVSSADKSALDTQKTNINTALTNVTNSEQTISSTKLTNESDINTARSEVSSTEGALKAAQDELALILAEPRQEDIGFYQAQLKQAQAKVSLLENQAWEATLRSPVKGQVTKINKEIGEQVSMAEAVVFLLPQEPFQVEVDIPESDIGKVDLIDPAKITLDAFPEIEFEGKIIEIEPAETVISGVVYYKIKVSLEAENDKVKPGMTADVVIITDLRENVLVIPRRAVSEKDGKNFVKLANGDTFEEVEVQTGLKGSQGEIEILSGLKEGDEVITFVKEK